MMKKSDTKEGVNPSQQITNQIAELGDWRGEMMARLRKLVLKAAPGLTEEWKWGTAVWSQNGNVVAINAFKDHVKVIFFKGAALKDPHGFFNASLESKGSRGIDLYEGDAIDETALKELIRAAVAYNASGGK